MTLSSLGWVDWALAAVLVLSIAVGLWRGLVFEVLSLVGWVAVHDYGEVCNFVALLGLLADFLVESIPLLEPLALQYLLRDRVNDLKL